MEGCEAPAVVVSTLREPDGKWLRVEVTDNGPGVPPEKQAEIFRPFVSTKGSRGTGLGLAVSRKILREHGGDILLQEPTRPGQHVRPSAADAQPGHAGGSRHAGRPAAGGVNRRGL